MGGRGSGAMSVAGQAESPRTDQDYLAWQLFGNHALRQGDWKIRWLYKSLGKGDWELFNLKTDAAERKDLAAERPDKVKEMVDIGEVTIGGDPTGLLRSADQLLRRLNTPTGSASLHQLQARVADLVWEANTGVGG